MPNRPTPGLRTFLLLESLTSDSGVDFQEDQEHLRILIMNLSTNNSWTFKVIGMNIKAFKETEASIVYQRFEEIQSRLNLWPTNYSKLASATMFTAFFGGNIFCPNSSYEGMTVQDYLQSHFINCYKYLAT